jgi:phosphatidylinositol alpha-1,6-mannosyltransferase
VFLHGIEVWAPLSPADRRLLREATVRLANSSFTARRVAEVHPDIGSAIVCPLALPPDHSTGEATPTGRPTPTVIVVGRMDSAERYKGHDQLIEAWSRVRQQIPDARLLVVGDGDDRPRLSARAEALGAKGAVEFTGFVPADRLAALYRASALLAMPSRHEGFGLVYLEAMRHGLPCIGSVSDAAGDVIEDGVSGFLVDQTDGRALADRIVRLLADESLRSRMGAAGRVRVASQFGYASFRARFAAALRRAWGGDAAGAVAPPAVGHARPPS